MTRPVIPVSPGPDRPVTTTAEMPTPLSASQEDAIRRIAAVPDGVGKHAAFLRCVLGERSYFEIALMSRRLADEPLDEPTMRYIAERWHADA